MALTTFIFASFILLCFVIKEINTVPSACTHCVESHKCIPPKCFCCQDDLAFPFPKSEIPQMVFFTFDDAVTGQASVFYRQLFDSSRKNPNDCPISMTLFVSHDNTEYDRVREFYNKGMEIGAHSVTHRNMNINNFMKEAKAQKENLAKLANISEADIKGWRSPFLKPTGDLQPSTLKELGYLYDATLTISKRRMADKAPAPFTLDYGWPYDCKVKPCPRRAHAGFWEVPVVSLLDYKNKYDCVYVDGCMNAPPDEESAYNFLWNNFNSYYSKSRIPFGINMHPSWFFFYEHRLKAMDRFIQKLVSLNDVYIVSVRKMIDWLKDPTPLSKLHNFKPWSCKENGGGSGSNIHKHRSIPSSLRSQQRLYPHQVSRVNTRRWELLDRVKNIMNDRTIRLHDRQNIDIQRLQNRTRTNVQRVSVVRPHLLQNSREHGRLVVKPRKQSPIPKLERPSSKLFRLWEIRNHKSQQRPTTPRPMSSFRTQPMSNFRTQERRVFPTSNLHTLRPTTTSFRRRSGIKINIKDIPLWHPPRIITTPKVPNIKPGLPPGLQMFGSRIRSGIHATTPTPSPARKSFEEPSLGWIEPTTPTTGITKSPERSPDKMVHTFVPAPTTESPVLRNKRLHDEHLRQYDLTVQRQRDAERRQRQRELQLLRQQQVNLHRRLFDKAVQIQKGASPGTEGKVAIEQTNPQPVPPPTPSWDFASVKKVHAQNNANRRPMLISPQFEFNSDLQADSLHKNSTTARALLSQRQKTEQQSQSNTNEQVHQQAQKWTTATFTSPKQGVIHVQIPTTSNSKQSVDDWANFLLRVVGG